jgi:hypothetical protein
MLIIIIFYNLHYSLPMWTSIFHTRVNLTSPLRQRYDFTYVICYVCDILCAMCRVCVSGSINTLCDCALIL